MFKLTDEDSIKKVKDLVHDLQTSDELAIKYAKKWKTRYNMDVHKDLRLLKGYMAGFEKGFYIALKLLLHGKDDIEKVEI